MRISTIGRASRILVAAALALAGCGERPPAPATAPLALGAVVPLPVGTFLAPAAGGAPSRVTDGGPALVLEQQGRWVRVLAADGSHGWTSAVPAGAVPARVVSTGPAADRSPDDPSAVSTVELQNPVVVTGASLRSAVASLEQNMIPRERNWLDAPWLRLRSGSATGWSPPSELLLSWPGSVKAVGMIRPPFTGQYASLLRAAPKPGVQVLRVNAAGDSASGGALEADETWTEIRAVRAGDGEPLGVLYAGARTRLLRLRTGALLFDTYLPEVDRIACHPLPGEQTSTCLAEVTQLTGDGHVATLWLVGRAGAHAVTLEASSGERTGQAPAGRWWLDVEAGRLWVIRADGQITRVLTITSVGTETPVQAFGALRPARESYEAAVADGIAATGRALPVLPVSERGQVRWAADRLFASRRDAERWTSASPFGARLTVTALGP